MTKAYKAYSDKFNTTVAEYSRIIEDVQRYAGDTVTIAGLMDEITVESINHNPSQKMRREFAAALVYLEKKKSTDYDRIKVLKEIGNNYDKSGYTFPDGSNYTWADADAAKMFLDFEDKYKSKVYKQDGKDWIRKSQSKNKNNSNSLNEAQDKALESYVDILKEKKKKQEAILESWKKDQNKLVPKVPKSVPVPTVPVPVSIFTTVPEIGIVDKPQGRKIRVEEY